MDLHSAKNSEAASAVRISGRQDHLGNRKDDFLAVKLACGAGELPRRTRILLTGDDRVRWLNGMVTNNIRDLAVGQGVYAFLLNPQGHIQADLYAFNRGNSILVETDGSLREKVLALFNHYIIMDDVNVEDVSDQWATIRIAGPNAIRILEPFGLSANPEPLQFRDVAWRGNNLTLVRQDVPAVDVYEISVPAEAVADLHSTLIAAGARVIGPDTWELLRISLGIPRYGQDIRERDLPQETEQQRALHFSKGCYVGQEIVERIRSRGAVHRTFTGFEVAGELPAAGSKIQFGGKEIGEITSSARIPLAESEMGIALGYIRREHADPAKELEAAGSRLVTATLPFAKIWGH